MAFDYFNKENLELSLECAESWFIDMPFSTRSAIFGHHIASVWIEDYNTALKFSLAGLISNPENPILINNMIIS